jgi:membrane-associated protease RseP (regulator of RpoE activity)
VIVVATEDFEVYHGIVDELRDRGAEFTTIEPGEEFPERTDVVIVAEDDPPPDDGATLEVVVADPASPREAVEAALAAIRGGTGRTVVGVDPGTRPGIAVLSGDTVVAAYQVPLTDAVDVIRGQVADAADPVVRIGDGARLQGARIVNELEDVCVELVDETGTTPYLGAGARGLGDVLAAVNIARMEGEVVDSRTVEPTEGELQVIQSESRRQSPENREIDADLARRVAAGELSITEALETHRSAGRDPTRETDDGE